MKRTGVRKPDLDQESLEDAIAQVKGVFSCQIVLDEDRNVQEVHVIGTHERGAKQIVRDIETLLRVRFGLPIDYRKISLVQMDEFGAKRMFARPQLSTVEGRADGDHYTVTVVVQQDNKEFRGIAGGGHTLNDRLHQAGVATLNAIGQIIERDDLLLLADARVFALGGKEVVAVAVVANFPSGAEHLVGLSMVRAEDDLVGEALQSAARATLAALNRRLPLLLSLHGHA
jgi:hypothetical protein